MKTNNVIYKYRERKRKESKMKLSEVKVNELEIRNYDVRYRWGTDWVTEYTYISEESLTVEQFEQILEGKSVYGQITFSKKVMNFANGQKLYKHTCKAVMY